MSERITPTKTILASAISVALSSGVAQAQEANRFIEEITVTATKREESLQDVPIAVTALSGEALEELGISNFSDYVLQLPGVTAGGSGPGQNTIYIRGVASTTPNLTTAGVAGLAPNVAFYLDEQPLSQPGRNLDVYAADLQRIEVLHGIPYTPYIYPVLYSISHHLLVPVLHLRLHPSHLVIQPHL